MKEGQKVSPQQWLTRMHASRVEEFAHLAKKSPDSFDTVKGTLARFHAQFQQVCRMLDIHLEEIMTPPATAVQTYVARFKEAAGRGANSEERSLFIEPYVQLQVQIRCALVILNPPGKSDVLHVQPKDESGPGSTVVGSQILEDTPGIVDDDLLAADSSVLSRGNSSKSDSDDVL